MKIYIHGRFSYPWSLEQLYRDGFEKLGHKCTRDPSKGDIAVVFKWLKDTTFLTGDSNILVYPDNPQRRRKYFNTIRTYFDHIFLCHKTDMVERNEDIHYLPFGYSSEIHHPIDVEEKDIDCLFIGTKHPSRGWMKEVPVIDRYGGGWEDSRKVGLEEYRELYSRAKTAVNFRFPGDYSNMRQWEVLAFNRPLLLSDHKGSFEDRKHLVVYEGIKDLKDKINYFLNHKKEREQIVKQGYECLVTGANTYTDRCKRILKTIE